MRYLIKFPSRERPEKFKACIDNIREMCAGYDYYIHATLDENDPRIEEYKQHLENIPHRIGVSKGKIDACNRDMEDILYPWDVVILMSDDMKIVSKRFMQIIEKHFETNGLDTILHLNDGNWYGNKLMTMNIQGKENFERFGYLYSPEYISLWCDNEQMEVGKILGNYFYVPEVTINHIHPAHVQGVVADDLLKRTEAFYSVDESTFKQRKARNFDLF